MTARGVALIAHPDTPCPEVETVHVRVERAETGGLRLKYTLTGDLQAVRIPPPGVGKRLDELWRHTCFEVFLLGADGRSYREFNFSPAGDWQTYDFRAYRDGGAPAAVDPPIIERTDTPTYLQLDITLARTSLPAGRRLGLSAVIETGTREISYWALRHAPGKADFHHTDAFALELT